MNSPKVECATNGKLENVLVDTQVYKIKALSYDIIIYKSLYGTAS